MLMQPDSLVGRRAFFASKHLFVTPFSDDQFLAAGDHVVQSEDCLGLKQWTAQVSRSVKGKAGGRKRTIVCLWFANTVSKFNRIYIVAQGAGRGDQNR
jgi:Cu2+-containing amine oxidase